jgi:hypothetical protein
VGVEWSAHRAKADRGTICSGVMLTATPCEAARPGGAAGPATAVTPTATAAPVLEGRAPGWPATLALVGTLGLTPAALAADVVEAADDDGAEEDDEDDEDGEDGEDEVELPEGALAPAPPVGLEPDCAVVGVDALAAAPVLT